MDKWIEDIRQYEPEVADYIQKHINEGEEIKSPALLWLKARRAVHGSQYAAVATFSSTPFSTKGRG